MFTFLRSERPTSATWRSVSSATSIACWTRWMFEANDAISTRPSRRGRIVRNASPTVRSDDVTPGPLGVRRVAEHQVDALVPELREPADVGAEPVDGRVVDLVVAGEEDPAAGRVEHDRDRVRNGMRHAHELRLERPERHHPVLGNGLDQLGRAGQAVLVQLRLDESERELRRPDLRGRRSRAGSTGARRRGPRGRA